MTEVTKIMEWRALARLECEFIIIVEQGLIKTRH
jgi:hypothetical protein